LPCRVLPSRERWTASIFLERHGKAAKVARMTDDRYGANAVVVRTPDGALVVEIRLEIWRRPALQNLIAEARDAGADAVWAYGALVDSTLGFAPRGGYVRLTAPALPVPVTLSSPPVSAVRELQLRCFSGVWGRHEPNAPDPLAQYVGLYEGGRWVGICEFDGDSGWIDGPGVIPELRTAERYAELVRGAAGCITAPNSFSRRGETTTKHSPPTRASGLS
jgi:hypothetical protein